MIVSHIVRLTAPALWFLLWTGPDATLFAESSVSAPADLQVIDTPNDDGGSLTVVWAPSPADSPEAKYQVLFGEAGASDPAALKVIAEFPADTRYVKEAKGAWWARAGEPSWHQYVIRSGKGVELKDGTTY